MRPVTTFTDGRSLSLFPGAFRFYELHPESTEIINDWAGKREGGETQTATDDGSIEEFGPRGRELSFRLTADGEIRDAIGWQVDHGVPADDLVLNAVRARRFLDEGVWSSKAAAAAWARARLPRGDLVDAALAMRRAEAGAVLEPRTLQALADISQRHDLLVVSDEIYDRIVFGTERDRTEFVSFLDTAPGLRERTVTVNGMSKSAAMTGWRIGYTAAPVPLVKAMTALQGQSTSNPTAVAQAAAVAALEGPQE